MIRNKYINIIIACIMALAIIGVTIFMALPQSTTSESTGKTMDYESDFSDKVIEVDIEADADDWQNMLDNATDETYISCNVKINGTSVNTVGIRPKGNSSLTQVASSESDRYSFKMEFDHYVDGQTYDGLDKLVLNNIQSDNSYMKEYLSYQMMDYIGVTTPLVTYANITVNGKAWGLYLAIEGIEDSYAERTDAGNLYKPESDDMGGGNKNVAANKNKEAGFGGGAPPQMNGQNDADQNANGDNATAPNGDNQDIEPPDGGAPPQMKDDQNAEDNTQNEDNTAAKTADNAADNNANANQDNKQKGGMGGGGSQNSEDCALKYIDDDVDSYSNIFENAVFDVDKCDKEKVITAIKNLNDGTDLEQYINVDEVLRYFAANTVLVNLDSYSGNMLHNYYLEEKDGQLSILPWDFNLSFAGFSVSSASDAVNFPIDTPVSGDLSDRPLIGKLLENDEYKAKFHEYLQEIVDGYFNSGLFENRITSLQKSISKYVKSDATAFCTYDEYVAGVDMLKTYGKLRAQSVEGQLDGTVPSTKTAQSEQADKLIDASSLNLSVMGSQGGGGGGMKVGNAANDNNNANQGAQNAGDQNADTAQKDDGAAQGAPNTGDQDANADTTQKDDGAAQNAPNGAAPGGNGDSQLDRSTMQKVMSIIGDSETLTDDQKSQLKELGLTDDQITQFVKRKITFGQGHQNGNNNANMQDNNWQKKDNTTTIDTQVYVILGASIFVVLLAIAIAFFFRKKI